MSGPIHISFASMMARAAARSERQRIAHQEGVQSRLVEELEETFNPAAVEREQSRYNRFRNLETRRPPDTTVVRAIEVGKKGEEDLASAYQRRNPELPADRLRALREALHEGQYPEEVLQQVNTTFTDPTLADEALEYLERSSEGNIRDNVTRARELLMAQKGREILAGRNIDSVAKSFYKQGIGNTPTELRNLYREITGNPRDHNTLFSDLSELYPFDQLKLVVAFLLKGLAYDLKSKGPSIQQAELLRLMTETRNLQSILWVYLYFKSRMNMIRSLYSQYGQAYSKTLTFERLAKEFIRLVEERYPSIMKLLKQAEKLGLKDTLEKIIILNQYRDGIRQLSPRLYRTLRHRQDLLTTIMEALEELEEREEEEEEEEREEREQKKKGK